MVAFPARRFRIARLRQKGPVLGLDCREQDYYPKDDVGPSGGGCEECLTCGPVGRCDSSKITHATHHPIVRPFEPGEDWRYCYANENIAPNGVDAVFDRSGEETFRRTFEAVRGGRVVTIVAFGEEVEPGREITRHASGARAQWRKLETFSEMFGAGKLSVEIEAAKAHERVEAGTLEAGPC